MRNRGQGIVLVVASSVVAGTLLVLVGCERLPWEAKTQGPAPAQTNPPSQQAAEAFVPESERIAAVNQIPLSTTDAELATLELKRFIESYQQEWKPLSATDNPDALDLYDVANNLIDAELKAQDAKARGLDRRTEAQRRLRYLQRGFYAQEWERWQRERAIPPEEEIHQFYERNKLGFTDPERIQVRQIVAETLAEAEAIRGQAIQGAVFAQLAREKSVGAGKEQGGDIGWHLRAFDLDMQRRLGKLTDQDPVKAFFAQLESVAFALEIGQVSQPVKGPDGRYYIVLLEERKPSRQQTELEVHDAIRELLTLQNLQRQLDQLRQKAKIERFPERLGNVQQ